MTRVNTVLLPGFGAMGRIVASVGALADIDLGAGGHVRDSHGSESPELHRGLISMAHLAVHRRSAVMIPAAT
jgi:hypothetical protein